jgi:hypothetical protein
MHRDRPTLFGPLVLVAGVMLALVLAAAAAAATPGRYVGKTAQGRPVSLRVNSSATRVRTFRIVYRFRCGGRRIRATFIFRNARIRRNRFRGAGSTRQRLDGGTLLAQRIRLAGRFSSSRRVAGRWTARVTVGPEKPAECSVRRLRWVARR